MEQRSRGFMKRLVELSKAMDKAMDKVAEVIVIVIGTIIGLCIVVGIPFIIVAACSKYLLS
jgi:hypothetical protein